MIIPVAVGSDTMKPFTHALALGLYLWVPTEGSSKRLFCFYSNPQGGLANGPCLGCTHKEMRLLTSQRVNLLEVSQEQSNWVMVV